MLIKHEITDGSTSTGTYLKQFMENYSNQIFYIDPIAGFRKHMISSYDIHEIISDDPICLLEMWDNIIHMTERDSMIEPLRILIDHYEMIKFTTDDQKILFNEKLNKLMELNPNVETIITCIGKSDLN